MTHSITGSASLDFFIDQPNTGGNLTVSGESVCRVAAATAAKTVDVSGSAHFWQWINYCCFLMLLVVLLLRHIIVPRFVQ